MDGLVAPTLRFLLLLTACGCQNFVVASEESGLSDSTSNVSSLVLHNLSAEGSGKTADNAKGLNGASGNNTKLVSSNAASSELSTVGSTPKTESQASDTSSIRSDQTAHTAAQSEQEDTESATAARALSDEKSDMSVRQGADSTSVVGVQAADPGGRSKGEDSAPSGQSADAASAPSRQDAASSISASDENTEDTDLRSQSDNVDGERNDPVTDIVDSLSDGASDSTRNDKSAENVSAASGGTSESASTGNDASTESVNSSSDRASGSESASDDASTDGSSSSGAVDSKNLPNAPSAESSMGPGDKSNASIPDGQSTDSSARSDRFTDAAAAAAALPSGQAVDSSSMPKNPSTKAATDGSSSPFPDGAQISEEEEEAWEVLDPSSEEALARAKKRRISRMFLAVYQDFVSRGRAKELMPDPFFQRNEPEPEPPEEPVRFGSRGRLPTKEVKPTDECHFVEGHDFLGHDVDTIQGSNKYDCCRACARRNRIRPGSCTAAVLSSELDFPPSACWLKNDIQTHTTKSGVVACIPKNSDVGSKFPDLVV